MNKEFVELVIGDLRSFGLDERWLQDVIAKKPEVLGIPDVYTRDRERTQPRAGRVDLLLETNDNSKRYEVEVQLGGTDESHIIRCIEYWDLERKRYPQYEHCAVIIAEDITSRFFNVINLFNGQIPIIAIKVTAVSQADNKMGLVFTKVLDENMFAIEEQESSIQVDRDWWIENKGKVQTELAEYLCEKLGVEFYFTKSYIAVKSDRINLQIRALARRNKIWLRYYTEESKMLDAEIEKSGLVYEYRDKRNSYYLGISKQQDIDGNIELLKKLLRIARGEEQLPAEAQEEQDDSA